MLGRVLNWYRLWVQMREIRYRSVSAILDEFDGIEAANDDTAASAGEREPDDETSARDG